MLSFRPRCGARRKASTACPSGAISYQPQRFVDRAGRNPCGPGRPSWPSRKRLGGRMASFPTGYATRQVQERPRMSGPRCWKRPEGYGLRLSRDQPGSSLPKGGTRRSLAVPRRVDHPGTARRFVKGEDPLLGRGALRGRRALAAGETKLLCPPRTSGPSSGCARSSRPGRAEPDEEYPVRFSRPAASSSTGIQAP